MAESVKESESPHSSRNAEARVDINPDKTRAVLYLRKGQDASRHLDIKTISQAIRDSGVHGFDSEALKNTISGFLEGKDEELKDYSLAEGIPSTRGKDREVTVEAVLLQDEEKEQAAERLIEWNSRDSLRNSGIDPQKADGFAYVEKDAVVARVASGTGGEAGKDIFGNIIPGLPGNDPDIKLLQGLEIHGSEITASQKGLFLFEGSGKSFRGAVIDYLDAKITVHVSDDAMEARGDLCREEGAGIPLTVENVKNVLTGLGIIKGVDWEAVEKACARAREKGCVTGLVLARGKAPLARGSPEPHWLVSMDPFGSSGAGAGGGTVSGPVSGEAADSAGTTAPNKITAPNEITATGCSAAQVKAGVHVLELSGPAEEGHPGYDVKGTVIPIERASVFSVEHDDSIHEIQQGATKRFVAARSGELIFNGKELKISSVRVMEGDVGPSIGGVNFSGEIQIHGNLLPGCTVISGSHVTVEGFGEEALVSAGGKAIITLGFKGGGKGIIRARAGIETTFAERASLLAVGDIHLKKGSIRSTIKTNGKLYISDANGKLSGGVCQARYGLDVMDLGSEKGIRTEISFGQDYIIKDQIISSEEEIIKIRRSLSEIEEKIKAAIKKNLPIPDDVRTEKVRLVKLMEQLNIKIFTLKEKYEEHYEGEIRIRGSAFPGVIIESHDRYYEVKQKRSRMIFYFDRENGSINEKPL